MTVTIINQQERLTWKRVAQLEAAREGSCCYCFYEGKRKMEERKGKKGKEEKDKRMAKEPSSPAPAEEEEAKERNRPHRPRGAETTKATGQNRGEVARGATKQQGATTHNVKQHDEWQQKGAETRAGTAANQLNPSVQRQRPEHNIHRETENRTGKNDRHQGADPHCHLRHGDKTE